MGGFIDVCFYKIIYECMMFSNTNSFVNNMLLFSYAVLAILIFFNFRGSISQYHLYIVLCSVMHLLYFTDCSK